MAAQLGNVLLWASILIAAGVVWLASYGGFDPQGLALAAAIVLVGLAARYVLAGGKKQA